MADLAFLVMDLQFCGRPDLARGTARAYFDAAADSDGQKLLTCYVAYRAIVRAKVRGIQSVDPQLSADDREVRRNAASAYWNLARGILEEPRQRPALVLMGGLPGTGKSTLARGLAAAANFTVVRSDEIRKELAGIPVTQRSENIYTPEWTELTYAECLRRAWDVVDAGGRVIVDASFAGSAHRNQFLETARQRRIPAVFLVCRIDPAIARDRLRARRNDASDADERVYDHMAARWAPIDRTHGRPVVEIDTSRAEAAVATALESLRELEMA